MRRRAAWLSVVLAGCSAAPQARAPEPAPAPPLAAVASDAADEAPRCVVDALGAPLTTSRDPSIGPASAPVSIVVFSDFQCPYCARVVGTLAELLSAYDGKVRLSWKHFPLSFHDRARPAAEAAQAVFELGGALAFFRFHDEAFAAQADLSRDRFVAWARAAGLRDMAAFERALDEHAYAAKVDDDMAVGRSAGVSGTPHFFVNGIELSGARPFADFKAVIDAELAKVDGAQASASCALTNRNYRTKEQRRAAERAALRAENADVWKVPLGTAPVRGPQTAPVTLVVFSDYECPYCKRVEPTLARVVERFGADVRVAWKDHPLSFHPRAQPAATLAREARAQKGDAAFWDVHDRLFARSPALADEDLLAIARDAGLDEARVKAALAKNVHGAVIAADVAQGDDLDVTATPTIYVNGRKLVGAKPFDEIAEMVEEELAKARDRIARGASPSNVYDAILASAKDPPPPERRVVADAPKSAPYRGGKAAKVVIQQFSDFGCPYCRKLEDTMKLLLAEYGDRVKVVWRDRPLDELHPDAPLAAEAAIEAREQKGNAGFWKMHELIFAGQSAEEGIGRAALERHAQTVGLDMARFRKALDDRRHRPEVTEATRVADQAKISGVPALVINGYFLSGAQSLSKVKRLVDRAMREAK